MTKTTNTAYIYQPHFMTNKFRVALNDQRGTTYNYIIVTCSPEYNGVYRYPSTNIALKQYEIWDNNHRLCLCVPIEDCEKRGELTDIKNATVIGKVKAQQETWFYNKVKNRDYEYKERPEWML